MLPSPKIVVVDDDFDDVQAIVAGMCSLGTTAFGLHYSTELTRLPKFPCLRILFLDLHLTGSSGSMDQQIKNTIGILAEFLAEDNGPYVVILWSNHVSEGFTHFRDALNQRLPILCLPLPLHILSLDKIDFIQTVDGKRRVDKPEELRKQIMGHIETCPQLAALLSWEEDVSRAADDTIRQIFQFANQLSGEEGEITPSDKVNRMLGELAVSSAGLEGARENPFRGVNEVLVQVVADRLQHRSGGEATDQRWKRAVTEFRKKSSLTALDSSLLNRFVHIEDGDLIGQLLPGDRGSVLSLSELSEEEFLRLWGLKKVDLLSDFCLTNESSPKSKESIEWIMAQVQPACDYAQRNSGLLPFTLGIRVSGFSNTKINGILEKKYLWGSPPLREDSEIYRLIFHLRFVAGLHPAALASLPVTVRYRLREQLLTDLSHLLHSYGGRPGLIRFPR